MKRISSVETTGRDRVRLAFGSSKSLLSIKDEHHLVELALPLLAGTGYREVSLSQNGPKQKNELFLWEDEAGRTWGACLKSWTEGSLEALTENTYAQVFEATADKHLHRLWNFVPYINTETHGMENYRSFCVGRREAFGKAFKQLAEGKMSAGTAVGIEEKKLIVLFLAGKETPRHFENPLQIPAYEYPSEYSPRPPSFARGSIVQGGDKTEAYISGTAAVRGHRSAVEGDLEGQIATTIEMLQALGSTMGAGPHLAAGSSPHRQFIVYVRRPRDLPAIQSQLEQALFHPGDIVTYLKADICRQELLLEIEGSLELP